MVTMQQIAEACGVSRGTVDRALHNKPGIRPEVAPAYRKKRGKWDIFPQGSCLPC